MAGFELDGAGSIAADETGEGWSAYARHVNPPLAELLALTARDLRFVKADGNRLTSDDGRVWLDWIAGFGSLNLGHNPPAILEVLKRHAAAGAPNLYVESLNPYAGALAQALVQAAGGEFETCFFSNSGTEAVEAALKLALAATRRDRVIYAGGAYHGATLGALSMMAPGLYRDPFATALCRWIAVPYNDAAALREAAREHAHRLAAIVLEPVQVESGVYVASTGFLQAARAAADASGALLVYDEAQTGMSRTGDLFRFQGAGVAPDVLILAKGLGAGVMPIGATLMKRGLFNAAYGDYLRAEAHHSTYGGNALACSVGLAALQALSAPALLAHVRDTGAWLEQSLVARIGAHPLVQRIVFKGFLGGIALTQMDHPWFDWQAMGLDAFAGKPSTGPLLVHRLHKRGHLLQICGHNWNALRIEPPLTVIRADCESLIDALAAELDWMHARG